MISSIKKLQRTHQIKTFNPYYTNHNPKKIKILLQIPKKMTLANKIISNISIPVLISNPKI
jgi:hypothetical protein